MYTAEQVLQGLINYVDKEVLAKLDTKGKIVLGTGITIAMQNASTLLKNIPENDIVKMLGVVDENGMYDVEKIAVALKANVEKFGKLQFDVPLVGKLAFVPEDVTLLTQYIKGDLV